ncbi:hypothetical protein ACLOJK_037276, partial [Asimina triloba]
MTGKKGMIMSEELVSLRSRYLIPNFFELLATLEGETLRSHREGCVRLNEWMFKARVRIPLVRCRADRLFWASLLSRKVILGGISFAGKRNTKIVSNLPDSVSDWKLRFFYARFRAGEEPACPWGFPTQWDNALPEVRNVRLEELERGQRSALEFLLSNSLKISDKYLSLPLSLFPFSVDVVGEGHQPVVAKEVVGEDVERRLTVLAWSWPLPRRVMTLQGCFLRRLSWQLLRSASLRPNPAFDLGVPKASERGDTGFLPVEFQGIQENHALGLPSSLDVQGRGPGEQMLKKFLQDVRRELSELEERIRLINRCASGEEYRYLILRQYVRFPVDRPRTQDRFGTSNLIDEEERRKVITAGKRPKEAVVRHVLREVLRPAKPILSEREPKEEWRLMEETSAKSQSIARRRME